MGRFRIELDRRYGPIGVTIVGEADGETDTDAEREFREQLLGLPQEVEVNIPGLPHLGITLWFHTDSLGDITDAEIRDVEEIEEP